MAGSDTDKRGRRAAALILVLLALAALASFLPLIETKTWWIRFLDFPRLQLATSLLLLLAVRAAVAWQDPRLPGDQADPHDPVRHFFERVVRIARIIVTSDQHGRRCEAENDPECSTG